MKKCLVRLVNVYVCVCVCVYVCACVCVCVCAPAQVYADGCDFLIVMAVKILNSKEFSRTKDVLLSKVKY